MISDPEKGTNAMEAFAYVSPKYIEGPEGIPCIYICRKATGQTVCRQEKNRRMRRSLKTTMQERTKK